MKRNSKLERLPKEVQEEVLETLKAYTRCYVMECAGTYRVSVGIALTASNYSDKCVASFENTDIYTYEEIKRYADEVWGGADMSAW